MGLSSPKSLRTNPENSDFALIGTEIGVWGTENLSDTNTSWSPYTNGLANVRVDMLHIRNEDQLVLASTHGRGQFYTYYNINDLELIGDINNDDSLDILDIVLLINLILSS